MDNQDLINKIRELSPQIENLFKPDPEIDSQINKILGTRDLKPTQVLEDVALVLKILYPDDVLHLKSPDPNRKSQRHRDQWYCWTQTGGGRDGAWGDTATIAAINAICARASK